MATTTRRQYRSGSVYQRGDGRWIGSLEVGETSKGNRRRVTVSATTEAACRRALDAKRDELARTGPPADGIDPRTTVSQWAKTWLGFTERRVRPKTWATNQSAVNLWIVPQLGKKRLDKLLPGDLRALEVAILTTKRTVRGVESYLSTNTALRAHAVLIKMLKDAVVDGHRINDGLFKAERPAHDKTGRTSIELADVRALLRTAAGEPGAFTRWLAALLQGMRQGECLGLRWSSINLEAGTLDVSWQLQPMPYRHGCATPCGRRFAGDCPERTFRIPPAYQAQRLAGAWHLVKPKTASGERRVALAADMALALAAWRAIAPPSPHDLVWPNDDGSPRSAAHDRADWHALQDRAGVRRADGEHYHLHQARNASVSLMSEAGVDMEVIKDVVGHANIDATRLYRQGNNTVARKALEDLAGRLLS